MTIKITPNDKGNPPGKLADAELHFTEGPLEGLKLIGFSTWERAGGEGEEGTSTFPGVQSGSKGNRGGLGCRRRFLEKTERNRFGERLLEGFRNKEKGRGLLLELGNRVIW